ncbi:MAG: Abi family protein [Megasphaera massiliensis]|uniref:Abi family protein n=1 Tax=Megasphaera TaxID=906 RepID=UPI00258DDEB0|nr:MULTISPECIES: Abi family protein [Megasphaera]MDY2965275.1 Abi family protein [Megasphaera massiliensis]
MKEFRSIEQQVQILEKRKLKIDNRDKVKRYLLTQNYYNIINGYANYFPRKGDQYTGGTSFDEISHLYVFEREVKQALLRAILTVETHFTAIFAHRFAEANANIPYAYLNINCYDKDKAVEAISTISRLAKKIEHYKKHKGSSIAHYVNQHHDVPIWVLANYLDFGELKYMFSKSTLSVQNAVAKDMLNFIREHLPASVLIIPFSPEVMYSFIENINDVRNICAHNNRLLGFTCRRDSKYWGPLHDQYNITPDMQRNTVYSVFLSLQCFLSKNEYGAVHNTIRKECNKLETRMKTIHYNEILAKLGFPEDWHKKAAKIKH